MACGALLLHLSLVWACNVVFDGSGLSLSRRDFLGQGHQDLWFLTVTAVIKTENLLEMRNRHCGETICLCATSSWHIKPGTPLAASHQDMAVLQKGWWQEKGWAPTARLAGVMPKLKGREAHVCVGSSTRLRLLLGAKARGRRCHMCKCWMGGFKAWKCWWGLQFYSIELSVVVAHLHL